MPGRANTSPTSLILENHVKNKLLIFGLPVIALIAIGCSSGGDDDVDTAGPGAQAQPSASGTTGSTTKDKGKKIVLTVAGAKKAGNVTYLLNGDTSQDNGVDLPWTKTVYSKEIPTIVSLSAQNAGTGKITCTITVDGKVAKENASNGEYAIVDCTTDAIM